MNDENDPRNKRFYHGGDGGLLVGQYIEPPNVTGKDNMVGLNPACRIWCVEAGDYRICLT
jgi:hypothetical protein